MNGDLCFRTPFLIEMTFVTRWSFLVKIPENYSRRKLLVQNRYTIFFIEKSALFVLEIPKLTLTEKKKQKKKYCEFFLEIFDFIFTGNSPKMLIYSPRSKPKVGYRKFHWIWSDDFFHSFMATFRMTRLFFHISNLNWKLAFHIWLFLHLWVFFRTVLCRTFIVILYEGIENCHIFLKQEW